MSLLLCDNLAVTTAASFVVAFITIWYTLRRGSRNWVRFAVRALRLQSPTCERGRQPSKIRLQTRKPQFQLDKELYYQLQNLFSHPECLLQARTRLLQLLDQSMYEALQDPTNPTNILSIQEYSHETLHAFLKHSANVTADKFAAYTERRKAGGPREMLPTAEYAKYWLRLAAPVKYVDGSWLGGIHRQATTQPSHRLASKTAWQILSEELGDGDIDKNHVWVYRQLINSTGNSSIGLGHEKKFVSNVHNPNQDPRVWTAAVSQQCISLFPDDMLPEMLGFNMAYETLPCHLLMTIRELKELKLDPYYFVLHVSIDNGHSGHAAMGAAAVTSYIDCLPANEEKEAAWKRVQAGYIMAEGIPTTPIPLTPLDYQVLKIFSDKCETAKPMHAFCCANIGGAVFGKTLSQWLDPEKFENWGMVFVRTIANSRWVEKGDPESSKLMKELRWGGRMFGAYTAEEVEVIEKWIEGFKRSEGPPPESKGVYEKFTGRNEIEIRIPTFPKLWNLPAAKSKPKVPRSVQELMGFETFSVRGRLSAAVLGSLLRLSAVPFEYFPSYPSYVSTAEGMASIRTLRALYGFLPEKGLCAGMDEVMRPADEVIGVVELGFKLQEGHHVEGESEETLKRLWNYIEMLSKLPVEECSRLVGCQMGFVAGVLLNEKGWKGVVECRKDGDVIERIGHRVVEAWRTLLEAACSGADAARISWDQVAEGWTTVVAHLLDLVEGEGGDDRDSDQLVTMERHQKSETLVGGKELVGKMAKFTDDIRGVYAVVGEEAPKEQEIRESEDGLKLMLLKSLEEPVLWRWARSRDIQRR
ncbi:hypothetical protein BDZ91DRAFT_560626 [Kalaharituber pfeilii]|nr:hypothetical protein BDZ91DRAFT_560626 [Kalaharituber pfeilii]